MTAFSFKWAAAMHAALITTLLCLPGLGHAEAGSVQFASGEVLAQRSGTRLALAKGSTIESGDVLRTGATGYAQVRFTDGGMLAMQPNSDITLQRYSDANDVTKDSFLLGFFRGGLRAITGLIGKRNYNNYKVRINTATIGIRGSGFSSQYNPDGTVSVWGELDEIEVCTQPGCVGLGVGQSVIVLDNATLPVRTYVQASLQLPELIQDITVGGNNVDSNGSAAIVPAQATTTCAPPCASPSLN